MPSTVIRNKAEELSWSAGLSAFAAALIVAVVFAVYAGSLHSPFIFDDFRSIQANPHIRIHDLSPGALLDAAFGSPLKTRPVANISFALNYYFGGLDPFGFRLVNVIVHAAAAVTLFFLFLQALTSPALAMEKGRAGWTALAAAMLWAASPLATNSVTYIVQRMTSLAALFYLLALFLYGQGCLAGGRKRFFYFAGCLVSTLLAFGSKENTFTLPFFLILYEWFFIADMDPGRMGRARAAVIVSAVAAAGLGLLVFGDPAAMILGGYAIRDFTPLQRIMTEWRVIVFYISLILLPLPSRMNLDHDFSISTGLLSPPSTVLSLLALLALLAFALVRARKQRLLSFAVLWFLGNLVIESSVIGLELVFEHRTYLPAVFFFPALAAPLLAPGRTWRLRAGLIAALVLLSAWGTWERNKVWQDEVTLRLDCARKSPEKPRARAILANALVRAGKPEQAVEHYRAALRLEHDPGKAAEIAYNLANVLLMTGRTAQAEKIYRKLARQRPRMFQPRLNLGFLLMREGRLDEAERLHRELVADFPDEYRGHLNYGILLAHLGKRNRAAEEFRRVLELDPGNREAARRLAGLARRWQPVENERERRRNKDLKP